METTVNNRTNISVPTDRGTAHYLRLLLFALVSGAISIWLLRQPWAKTLFWPWIPLLAAMILGGIALRKLEPWLPGEIIPPHLAAFPERRRRILGIICLGAALFLVGLVMVRLWPDYSKWHGTPLFWLAALVLTALGGWLIGAVGQESSRAVTAVAWWPGSRRLEAVAFVLILLLAVFLRTYRIDSIPSGIYVDETNGSLDALYLLEGRDASPFATGWYGTPNGYIYYMAATFRLLGANWISLKVVSLLPAILTIPAIYLLGRLLFGPAAGLSAMLLLAVSRWHLSMSRWGWNETAPPLFQVLSFFFLIRGLRDRRALDYVLSGLLIGLSVYTYLSSRLAIATLALYVIYWIISDPKGLPTALRWSGLGILLLVSAALVAVGPILVTYITDPFALNNRVSEISIFRDVNEQGSLAPLAQNIVDVLRFFHQSGDNQGKHNLPYEPMTDPVTGLLFAIGVGYAIYGWRDQRRVLLLLWLVIGLSGSFLSSQHESPQSYRSLTALPAVVLMAADVLDRIARALYRTLRERTSASAHSSWPAFAAGGLVVLALAGAGIWETGVYFGPQASSVEVIRGFNPTENGVARETIAALQSNQTVYLSPNFSGFSPLRFLVYGVVKAETGRNTLDDRPYHVMLPEVNLPLPDDGHDTLILLDSDYWPLRSYIASFYPQAKMELVTLPDNSPLYMRVALDRSQVAALQGLTERLTDGEGHQETQSVSQVLLETSQVGEVTWEGAVRLEHGGQYDFRGEGGLQMFLDGQRWMGPRYLGRGLYGLRVVRPAGTTGNARLLWQTPDHHFEPVRSNALFRIAWPAHGLLGRYYRNPNWEGQPLFQQVTPFLLLAWPDEQPIVPNGAFSAHFSGMLRVSEAGNYQIRVEADDGARLTLDGQVLGEGLVPNQPNRFETHVELTQGDHPIQVDYFQSGGGSALRVYWRHQDEPWMPIPPDAFIPESP
jgi:hypothetical protein